MVLSSIVRFAVNARANCALFPSRRRWRGATVSPTVRSADRAAQGGLQMGGRDMNPTLVRPGLFRDRREAGRVLAEKLAAYANRPDVVVLALPRCGVPVAYEVARRLVAPLDVFVVRKLGVPGYEELAMGAVASGRVRVLHD